MLRKEGNNCYIECSHSTSQIVVTVITILWQAIQCYVDRTVFAMKST